MPIEFSPKRWQKVKQTYQAWWQGELDRPIIPAIIPDRDPGRPQPPVPMLIQVTCKRLSRSFYHLVEVGQIPHLDQILSIKELDGLQRIHGDGKPDFSNWPEIYQKAHAAGKRI